MLNCEQVLSGLENLNLVCIKWNKRPLFGGLLKGVLGCRLFTTIFKKDFQFTYGFKDLSQNAEEEIIYITYDDSKNLLLIIPHSIQLTNYRIQSNILGMRMIVREVQDNTEVTTPIRPRRSTTPIRSTPPIIDPAM